jgi:HK97 gp10 family phage protein
MARTHITAEVENLKQVQKMIRDLGDTELRKQLREANKNVAQMVVDAALPNVPVRSGKLRASVKASATQTAAYGKAGSPVRVPYAAAIHWGEGSGNVGGGSNRRGRNIQARPFLWDAADRTINRAVKEYEDQIQDLIDKVVR